MMISVAAWLGLVVFLDQGQWAHAGGIVLERWNPTLFNYFSDMVAEVSTMIFGAVMVYLYGIILSLHLKRENSSIPVSMLGETPDNFLGGFMGAKRLKWSFPVVAFALLLTVNQLAHGLADLGMDFDNFPEKSKAKATSFKGTSESLFTTVMSVVRSHACHTHTHTLIERPVVLYHLDD